MRIAFDLDNTLIPNPYPFPTEPMPVLARWLGGEPLRLGTVSLFGELRGLGHEVWIYTTSFRKPLNTRLVFACYGARVGRVINADGHRTLGRLVGR